MHWHNPGPIRRPPSFIEPCLPCGPQWAYEIKHDARFVCLREGKRVRLGVVMLKTEPPPRHGPQWLGRLSGRMSSYPASIASSATKTTTPTKKATRKDRLITQAKQARRETSVHPL